MLPVNKLKNFVSLHKLFEPHHKILLAVSGGKDSVLMTHLFSQAGYAFGIAHCNFQLRDLESSEDECFVKSLAKSLGVPFHSTRFETQAYAKQRKLSIQMAARELRYNWLETCREAFNYHAIALAHHQNDVIETVLLNLIRGTGIAGLHGIFPKTNSKIRPLLFLHKGDIDQIINTERITYREDGSNYSLKYVRNKLRHHVVPLLKELNPQLEKTFEANTARFRELESFLIHHVEKLRQELFKWNPLGYYQINLQELHALYPQKLLLFELFKPFGFNDAIIDNLTHAWRGQVGKTFFAKSYQMLVDRQKLILKARASESSTVTHIHEQQKSVSWKHYHFCFQAINKEGFCLSNNKQQAFLNAALLHYPLTIRSWQNGDSFRPLGMHGQSKKLSDYLVAAKVPSILKKDVPIFVNGNGDILWLAGHRIDERYKVTSSTKRILVISIEPQ